MFGILYHVKLFWFQCSIVGIFTEETGMRTVAHNEENWAWRYLINVIQQVKIDK